VALALCSSDPAAAQPWKKKQPYADGSEIRVTGAVTDQDGHPIPDLLVQLRSSRREINFAKLRKEEHNPVLKSATTNSGGQFALDWTWHHYYNTFTVQAVVPVRRPRGEVEQRVLVELDISDRMTQGSPVVVPLTLADTKFLIELRAFEASIRTDEQVRVHEQHGKPDKVETFTAANREEATWWYFKTGMLFRFADDRLVEVENFDPVVGFDASSQR
jgi:hypothetical protein